MVFQHPLLAGFLLLKSGKQELPNQSDGQGSIILQGEDSTVMTPTWEGSL